MSHYFGDFSIGQIFLSPKPRLITEDLIGQFGEVSGDLNPLHFDESFAKASPFGKKIAHGLLGLSVASGLLHSTGIVRESIVACRRHANEKRPCSALNEFFALIKKFGF